MTGVLAVGQRHALLTATVEGWLAIALKEVAPADEVVWAVSFQAMPDPTQENSWVPMLVIYFELALSETNAVYSVHMVPPFALTKQQVTELTGANILALKARQTAYVDQPEKVSNPV